MRIRITGKLRLVLRQLAEEAAGIETKGVGGVNDDGVAGGVLTDVSTDTGVTGLDVKGNLGSGINFNIRESLSFCQALFFRVI